MGGSIFADIASILDTVRSPDGEIRTVEFLDTCRQVLPVIDKFGTGLSFIKADIGGNVDRLAQAYERNRVQHAALFSIVLDEVQRAGQHGRASDTKGLLWLKRAMDLVLGLLQRLHDDRGIALSTAAGDAYADTLKQYHTWLTSTAVTLALNFVPSRETFFAALGPPGEGLMDDLERFLAKFRPVIAQVDGFLKEHKLDDPTRV